MNGTVSKNSGYRPDIDGLRAIAVLLVVLFHAGLGFPGGYVGVDVFFVISGYLITGIIVRNAASESGFSCLRFWQRRIHRILPPMIVMLLAVLLVGLAVMRPLNLEAVSATGIAQVFMASNVQFWRMTEGYFSPRTELWPLLHTWSLSVEEQFYLLYPLTLAVLLRKSRVKAEAFVWGVVLASLGCSIAFSRDSPEASFYLLPTRAWELGLGAILAIRPIPRLPSRWSTVVSLLGLVLILGASIAYDETTVFPGHAAILPCLGAAMVVGTRSRDVGHRRVWLDNRIMVAIGLASYSIYLWHWPILAFARYLFGVQIEPTTLTVALILIAVFSWASFRFIETPCRRLGDRMSIRASLAAGGLASTAVLLLAIPIWLTGGANVGPRAAAESTLEPTSPVYRLDTDALLVENRPEKPGQLPVRPLGMRTGEVDFVLWGDSHASAVASVFDASAANLGMTGALFQKSGAVPIPALWSPNAGEEGRTREAWVDAVVDEIGRLRPKAIFLCGKWSEYLLGHGQQVAPRGEPVASSGSAVKAFEQGLDALHGLMSVRGTRVFVMAQAPRQFEALDRFLFLRGLWAENVEFAGISRDEFERQHHSGNRIFRRMLGRVEIIAPEFDGAVTTIVDRNGRVLFADDDHVSPSGAEFFYGDGVRKALRSIRDDDFPRGVVE